MFNKSTETKIAVLEERMSSYEVLLNKIDEAIQIMGKSTQSISEMLAVHEERIEVGNKEHNNIIKLIDKLKEENNKQHGEVQEKIQKMQDKLNDLVKFRWIIVGVVAAFTFALSQSNIIVDILTPHNKVEHVTK